jgi:hypothetical protein
MIALRKFPIHNALMLVKASKNGRRWAVCGTADPHVRHAMREEVKAAAAWYFDAVWEGRIESEKALGLKLDDRGCVKPQIVIPYRSKCAHRGWRGKKPLRLGTCPQHCCKALLHWETVKADREYFRDIKNTTRSDHVEHDLSVEREFEVARWRALTVKTAVDMSRVLWWDYPTLAQHDPWMGPKPYCLRHFSRALEVAIEYQLPVNVLDLLKDIPRDENGNYLPTLSWCSQWSRDCRDRRAVCHWPPIAFDCLNRRTGSGRWVHGGLQRSATYFRLEGNWTGTRYVRFSKKECT